jgi:hypothetical protein
MKVCHVEGGLRRRPQPGPDRTGSAHRATPIEAVVAETCVEEGMAARHVIAAAPERAGGAAPVARPGAGVAGPRTWRGEHQPVAECERAAV